MANRLRQKTARVSFFAFQDMITTVTGVLILVTLLLTLYLNQPAKGAVEVARDQLREQLHKAQEQLSTSLAELGARRAEVTAAGRRVFVVAEADRSALQTVLVVLSADRGSILHLHGGPTEFAVSHGHTSFGQALDQFSPAKHRLLFYVRPSGIAHFNACRAVAQRRGFGYGYDAAEENLDYRLGP
jgi:hypothetical protein